VVRKTLAKLLPWARRRARSRKWRVLAALLLVLAAVRSIRPFTLPQPPRPDEATFAQAKRVRIVRDSYGVPHVFGQSDADAAFGLAYANAEDDFPTIQGVLAAATGRLSLLALSKVAIGNDYYVGFARVREQVAAHYQELGADYREVLEGYARGLNLYAYLHPKEADGRLFPVSGRDVAAGFAHKLPLLLEVHKVLGELVNGPPHRAGEKVLAELAVEERVMPGSNAHALGRARSTDDVTRLNVNSHQPWEGPVAWYEAHVVSEAGWNMTGGLFPGSPMVLHGHNEHLGWAHTVNTPDLVDVYELHTDAAHPDAYELDGAWIPFEKTEVPLPVDTGFFTVTVHKTAYFTKLGPAVVTDEGAWAIRFAGIDRSIFAGEQWFRMNKATTWEEWGKAMRSGAIPMFNTVYADRDHIHYVYNASMPKRAPGHDWSKVLPGNDSSLIWSEYVAHDDLPQVTDPVCGFVQSCNSSPTVCTCAGEAPKEGSLDPRMGIVDPITNRARVTMAALSDVDVKLSPADFLRLKWDASYAPESAMVKRVLEPLLGVVPENEAERTGLALLASWDRRCDVDSRAAALAILTYRGVDPDVAGGTRPPLDAPAAFRKAVRRLVDTFGRVDVRLGEVQRLRRGSVDLPLGGGPDVLNATYVRDTGDRLIGKQGDSYVLVVDFTKSGPVSRSIHQYGASSRSESKHHADQAPLFVAHQLKSTYRNREELAAHTERSYSPGEP
jgi:acyl-homoserine-lactone acylase